MRPEVGAQPSESEEVVSTALGGDWEFRGVRAPVGPGARHYKSEVERMSPIVGITSWKRRLDTFYGPDDLQTLSTFYTDSVIEAGMTPLMFPSSLDPATAEGLVALVEGVVLSGGDDIDPLTYGEVNTASTKVSRASDQFEIAVVEAARRRASPSSRSAVACNWSTSPWVAPWSRR